jgi:hypothetical protein
MIGDNVFIIVPIPQAPFSLLMTRNPHTKIAAFSLP